MNHIQTFEKKSETPSSTPPLLFIHGACLGAWCWSDHFLDYFASAGYHAVALNLRGHGESAGEDMLKNLCIDDFVNDVAAAAKGMVQPPVVIGHSMGGLIAQRYASRYTVSGLILMASSPVGGMRSHGLELFRAHPLPFLSAILARDMQRIYPDNRRVRHIMFSPNTPEETVTRCRERLQTESWIACQEMNPSLEKPYPITCRILVLGGELDNTVPPEAVRETAMAYQAPCRIFADCGHNLMLENSWREVASYMEEWLSADDKYRWS